LPSRLALPPGCRCALRKTHKHRSPRPSKPRLAPLVGLRTPLHGSRTETSPLHFSLCEVEPSGSKGLRPTHDIYIGFYQLRWYEICFTKRPLGSLHFSTSLRTWAFNGPFRRVHCPKWSLFDRAVNGWARKEASPHHGRHNDPPTIPRGVSSCELPSADAREPHGGLIPADRRNCSG